MIDRRWFALVLLAGCSPEPPPKPAPKPAAVKPADPDALPVYAVAVDKRGLLLTNPKTRQAKPAAFGLRQSLIIAILTRTLGSPQEGRDAACAKDFARWNNGLTLWFDAGTFAGWSVDGADATVALAPEMTRAAKMAAGVTCD